MLAKDFHPAWTRSVLVSVIVLASLTISCESEWGEVIAPANTPTPVPSLTELKSGANRVTYEDLFRYNERYVGQSVYYRGEIIQVLEGPNETYTIRANVTEGAYGLWTDDLLLLYRRGDGVRVLEDDIIQFVGTVTGLHQYETILGGQRTVPLIEVLRLTVE